MRQYVCIFLFVSWATMISLAEDKKDLVVNGPPDADKVSVRTLPEISVEETTKVYAKMKPIGYIPPNDRWTYLPKTKEIFAKGGEWRVVLLGDSIVNDTARSNWSEYVQALYPKVKVVKYTVVRGSTGCEWYKEPGRVQRYVLDFQPTIVMIGGISQGQEVQAIQNVIHQIRKASTADIFLMTGAFGNVDPNEDAQWKMIQQPNETSYPTKLANLARTEKAEFLDLQKAWAEYVRGSGRKVTDFKRDPIHANREGEQILGRILVEYFAPKKAE